MGQLFSAEDGPIGCPHVLSRGRQAGGSSKQASAKAATSTFLFSSRNARRKHKSVRTTPSSMPEAVPANEMGIGFDIMALLAKACEACEACEAGNGEGIGAGIFGSWLACPPVSRSEDGQIAMPAFQIPLSRSPLVVLLHHHIAWSCASAANGVSDAQHTTRCKRCSHRRLSPQRSRGPRLSWAPASP